MIYALYPPFFIVPEESDFADAWESFCCKLLNIAEMTDEIYRRAAPEQGIDLYYPTKHVAYQCKSVESGKSGDFRASSAITSIKAAKAAKHTFGWNVYAVCTNVDISGSAERKIREELPDVILLPRSCWQNLCEKNPELVERNFRILVEVPHRRFIGVVEAAVESYYSDDMKAKLEDNLLEIFLYSQYRDKVYRFPVSLNYKVELLLRVLREFFQLPEALEFSSTQIKCKLDYFIMINGNKVEPSRTLAQIGVASGSVIMLCVDIDIQCDSARFRADVIQKTASRYTTIEQMQRDILPQVDREIRRAFEALDTSLE